MTPTKHHIMRLSDEHWNLLAEKFRLAVPFDCRPKYARRDSDWQISEGLRMVADGEITLVISKKPKP